MLNNIENKLILAPMALVTDAPFRAVCRKFGAALTFTQMVSAKGALENNFDALRFLAFSRSEKPIGVQLLGSDPDILGDAVKEIRKYSPDWIDLNSGCPSENLAKYSLGASLLTKPDILAKLVRALKDNAGDIPVSIKLRLGPDSSNINVIRNAKIAEDNGADAVIIHARKTQDPYSSTPDIDWIRKVKENVKIRVIGNGSVFNAYDAAEMIKKTNCDAVLVARGAIGNPFIFEDFMNGNFEKSYRSLAKMLPTFKEHIKLISKEYGPINSIGPIKKQIFWYFRFFDGIENLIRKILHEKEIESIMKIVERHVDKIERNFYPPADKENIQRKFEERIIFWENETASDVYQIIN